MSLRFRLMVAALAVALAPPAAHAHRAQTVFTTLIWNQRTGSLEVTHRLHAHDAELSLAGPSGAQPDLDDVRNQARVALKIEHGFALSGPDGPLVLETLGAEIEGDMLVVYQEVPAFDPAGDLVVRNTILREKFAGQTNLVSVQVGGRTRTLTFSGPDVERRLEAAD